MLTKWSFLFHKVLPQHIFGLFLLLFVTDITHMLLLSTVLSCVYLLHSWNMFLYFFPLFSIFSLSLVIVYLSEEFNIKMSELKKAFSYSIQKNIFEIFIECSFLSFPKHFFEFFDSAFELIV